METTLVVLPPEVLQQLTSLLEGFQVILLWRAGNKLLNWKLSTGGGTTELVLADHSDLSISRYPKILDSMSRLEKLQISCAGLRICSPNMLWNHLSKLVNLRDLHLDCVEAEEWLLNEEDSVLDFGGVLSDEWGVSEPAAVSRLRPIASTFPRLERLRLCSTKPVLRDSDFADFPEYITSLCVQGQTYNCYKYLPGKHKSEQ